jgi:hypothetical protein
VREKGRLRMFENMVLWKKFGPKRDKVRKESKRLYNEEFDELCSSSYYSGDQIKNKEIGQACSTYGEKRGADRVLVLKPGRKRTLERLTRRWEDNIKMNFQEMVLEHGLDVSGS